MWHNLTLAPDFRLDILVVFQIGDKMNSVFEQRAKEAENFPDAFGPINLTDIRTQVDSILSLVGRGGIFHEYTLHDATHIDELLKLAEQLVPEATINALTTADCLLIVLSIYLHDLGMLVTEAEYVSRDECAEFQTFKTEVFSDDKGKDYEFAIQKLSDEERDKFLYQEFVRLHHAVRIEGWIRGNPDWSLGQAQAAAKTVQALLATLDQVVKDDLALICRSHHEDDLHNFTKYRLRRVYSDFIGSEANVHYAALILRSADVLQIQRKRAPTVLYRLIDPSNPKSQEEWAKQAAVRSVRPKTHPDGSVADEFEVHATFDDDVAYFGLLAYIKQYATKELQKCHEWALEASKDRRGYDFPWTAIDTSNIEPRGFEPNPYSFTLDQERILKLLTGHTLYNDARVALRELVQNAIDAVRFRHFLNPDEPMGHVTVNWDPITRRLTIADTGIGMTKEIIQRFLLNVGASYYQSSVVRQQYSGFNPISRFGIGVMSSFMIADDVQILTVHPDESFARSLTLPSVVNVYLGKQLQKTDQSVIDIAPHGTKVILSVRRSADLENVEQLLRYWIVFPECDVLFSQGQDEQVKIGFEDAGVALEFYWNNLRNKEYDWFDEYECHFQQYDDIDIAFVTVVDRWSKEHALATRPFDNYRDVPDELMLPAGTCIEGIRVSSVPAGFNDAFSGPWVLANLKGSSAPSTNVARSSLDSSSNLKPTYSRIYGLLLDHVMEEFKRLQPLGFIEAGYAAHNMWSSIRRASIADRSSFEERLAEIPLTVVEQHGSLETLSKSEVKQLGEVWTCDAALLYNLEDLCRNLGVNRTAVSAAAALGSSSLAGIPDNRVLGYNTYVLEDLEVSRIKIDSSVARVDLCWSPRTNRWIKLEKWRDGEIYMKRRDVFVAVPEYVETELDRYSLITWREREFIVSEAHYQLIKYLGNNSQTASWIAKTIHYIQGLDNSDLIHIKEMLIQAGASDHADGILGGIKIPFESRFTTKWRSPFFAKDD